MFDPKLPYETEVQGDATVERHESFGMVSIHRTHGGNPSLFGTHLDNHHSYFVIEVKQGTVSHSLGRDWYSGAGRRQLIEIHLSAAQFAEMITTPNTGEGTPCTIHRVLGDRLEEPPRDRDNESKRIQSSFKEDLKNLAKSLVDKAKKIDTVLEKKNLNLADREEIRGALRRAIQDVQSNLPFMLTSFQESTEKTVTQAKAEVEAFLSLSLHRLGIDSMHKNIESGDRPMKALKAGDDD